MLTASRPHFHLRRAYALGPAVAFYFVFATWIAEASTLRIGAPAAIIPLTVLVSGLIGCTLHLGSLRHTVLAARNSWRRPGFAILVVYWLLLAWGFWRLAT